MTRRKIRIGGHDYVVETGGSAGPVVRYQLDGGSASLRGAKAEAWLRQHGVKAAA